eukprot:Rmarinus@m.4998
MEDTSKEHKFAIETHIRRRYATKEVIGQGSYGVVWRAKDLKAGGIVAMKKIFGAFENKTDAQRCLREIDFLCQLAGHPNIVRLLRVYRAANNYDLYLIFELLSLDLHRAIQAKILQEVQLPVVVPAVVLTRFSFLFVLFLLFLFFARSLYYKQYT